MVSASSQDEALDRYSVSSEVPRSILKCEMLLFTLDVTPKVPRHTVLTEGKIGLPRANPRGRLRYPSYSRIPPQLEKNHEVPSSSKDEALPTTVSQENTHVPF